MQNIKLRFIQASTTTSQEGMPKAKRVRRGNAKGFRLSHNAPETEDMQRENEHKDVKVGKLTDRMVPYLNCKVISRIYMFSNVLI